MKEKPKCGHEDTCIGKLCDRLMPPHIEENVNMWIQLEGNKE